MANRNFSNSRIYTMHTMPVLLDCNFVVDSTNENGLGIRDLKGPLISAVYMHTTAEEVAAGNPNPGGTLPAGSPNLGMAASFGILGASAITNTGATTVSGDMGISPGTSITGFPPGTVAGTVHVADSIATQAQTDAMAAYTEMAARSSTVIPSALDAQTLTAGVYSFASGAATLATSAPGTLTFSGSATDIFIIKTASTLTTGAGGAPTITMAGGALSSNVYWVIGSSATINSGTAGTFRGTLIAQVSVTDTMGGTIDGRLIALTGAVTLSAATTSTSPTTSAGGVIVIKLSDSYSRAYLAGISVISSPNSGTPLTSTTAGNAYTITALGTATTAQWVAKGLPTGYTPVVGASFVATASGSIGGSAAVQLSATAGSNITSVEVIGNPSMTLSNTTQGVGGQILLQCFRNGVKVAPADGTLMSLGFYLSNSSLTVQGE